MHVSKQTRLWLRLLTFVAVELLEASPPPMHFVMHNLNRQQINFYLCSASFSLVFIIYWLAYDMIFFPLLRFECQGERRHGTQISVKSVSLLLFLLRASPSKQRHERRINKKKLKVFFLYWVVQLATHVFHNSRLGVWLDSARKGFLESS